MSKTILFRISNAGIFYNATDTLKWSVTNIPSQELRFTEQEPIYWEVEMLGYHRVSQILDVKVIDYFADEEQRFAQQQLKAPVSQLCFRNLEEATFKSFLTYYRAEELTDLFSGWRTEGKGQTLKGPTASGRFEVLDEGLEPTQNLKPETQNQHSARKVNARIPLAETRFADGCIHGYFEVSPFPTPATFTIENAWIVKEFDLIKSYFARVLKRKTVEVSGDLKFQNDGTLLIENASSPQLSKIDGSFLKVLRIKRLKSLLESGKKEVDQSLFTLDQMLASPDDDRLAKTTQLAAADSLLEEILELNQARNARQLAFLAKEIQQPAFQLLFTLSPHFGFVFRHRGTEMIHFIWELLDSHATYIWSFMPGSDKDLIHRIEQEISFIEENGRLAYRHRPKDFAFEIVIHEGGSRNLKDGFPRWRLRLLEKLV